MKVIVAKEKLDCEHLLGTFLDERHYDTLVDYDCDVYMPNSSLTEANGEHNLAFKFRKGVFSDEEQVAAYEGLIGAATPSQNRGLAAGPKGEKLDNREWVTDWQMTVLDALIDPVNRLDGQDSIEVLIADKKNFAGETTRGMVWLRSKIIAKGEEYEGFFERWLEQQRGLSPEQQAKNATNFADTCISQTTYANPVNSGVAGFFDRYPRYPYGRICSYNWKEPDTFAKSFPYLHKLDKEFESLLPARYAKQRAAADKMDARFMIAGDTVFTTLTINKTFRTAAHRDAGDLSEGFSNLGVVNAGKNFKGGYLVLPEYRIAINVRPGDLLLIANHDAIHGNTPIEPAEVGCCPDCIERMSIVAYFREDMLNLGSWEYETARRDFVEHRRLDPTHPLARERWNGVSSGMFTSDEWYKFLYEQPDGDFMIQHYHPEAIKGEATSLEDFFV